MAAGGSKRGRFLEEFRGRLLAHRRALFEDYDGTQDDILVLEAAERGEPEVVERAQADSLARLLARLADRQQAELREIQDALGRIVAGTYGFCLKMNRET
jgi:RNA polymerase-binding transcription factor DksA